jgi:hypothetical protein
VRGRTEKTLSASRSMKCSLTFEKTFRAGGLRPGQPSGRSSSDVWQRGQAAVGGNFLRTSDVHPLGDAPTTGTAGRETRNAGPSGPERRRWIPNTHDRSGPSGSKKTRVHALPLRRRSTRPRGPFGDFARTSAGSSEQAERTSPRRWSVRSHHTSVLVGAPSRQGHLGGTVGSVAAQSAGSRAGWDALRPRHRARVNHAEQLRRRCEGNETSTVIGWSQGSRQPTATSR